MKLNLEQLENLRIAAGIMVETEGSVLGATVISLLDDYETAQAQLRQFREQTSLIVPGSAAVWDAVGKLYEVANAPAKDVGSDMDTFYAAIQAVLDAWERVDK